MSERLYYPDAYTTTFDAEITERLVFNDQPAVVLDRSFFYPTSGGQPHDVGTLSAVNVTDVLVRKEDGAVIHLLEHENLPGSVTGQVDWGRRFDHMQHHCGQHILSRAFIEAVDAPTMSFHMGPEFCTIDIDVPDLSATQVQAAEALANKIVQENRPVETSQVSIEEARSLPIRKLPPIKEGLVRLVNITDFDLTACGGTHVSRTGEIGLIKVTRLEKRKKMLRVEFLCGNRAIADYGRKTDILHDLTRQLSTGATNLTGSIDKLQQENKMLGRDVRNLRKEKMAAVAQQLEGGFEPVNGVQLLTHTFTAGETVDDLRQIGNSLIGADATGGRVVLLGSAGDDARLVFVSSAGEKAHMGQLLRSVLEHIGSKSGGGQQTLAQGGGQPASAERVTAALEAAKEKIAV